MNSDDNNIEEYNNATATLDNYCFGHYNDSSPICLSCESASDCAFASRNTDIEWRNT